MANLNQNAITLVSSTASVDMKTAASVTLYTVPVSKTFIPILIVLRNNSASMAGGVSYSFTNWRQTVDLSGLTVTTGYRVLQSVDNTTYTPLAAGVAFQITVTTGATLACTATLDTYGYLF